MVIGAGDIGVFFGDFGVPVSFNGVSAVGLLDQASASENFGGSLLEKDEIAVTVPAAAFQPSPRGKSAITVAGQPYMVQESKLLDDGALLWLRLKEPK